MLFKQILMIVICVFFVLGMLDYFFGGRFGIGAEFQRAFGFAGAITLGAVGMICLSPVLAAWIEPLVVPVYRFLGADAAMFAPTFLSPDSGGYAIATRLASDPAVGAWAGTVVAAHLGGAISFNIPISLGIIGREHYRLFSLGTLSGLMACPFGCVLGGVLSGLPLVLVLKNMVPGLLVSLVICLGLILIPDRFIRGFVLFGRTLTFVVLIGLSLAVIERLTGFVLVPGMTPLSTGLNIVGNIVATIAGIFGLTYVILRCFRRQLDSLGRLLRINVTAILGIFNGFAAIIPGCVTYGEMDRRGKILFAATAASSANILGAHLGFIGTTAPEMLMPTVLGKLFSGLLAVLLALLLSRKITDRVPEACPPA